MSIAVGSAATLQWASADGVHGTARVSELEAAGWRQGSAHPFFAGTWLMEQPQAAAGESGSLAVPVAKTPEELPRREIGPREPQGTVSAAILVALADGEPATSRGLALRVRLRRKVLLAELRALEAAGQLSREGRGRSARFRRTT